MGKQKYPKAVYQGVGHRLILDWLFPKTGYSFLGVSPYERRPKIYSLGRLALYDGGAGLLGTNQKRKPELIPSDFRTPFPPLEFPSVDEWRVEEWRDYALLQQDLADALQEKLAATWGELLEAQDRLSRKKSPSNTDAKTKSEVKPPAGISGGLLYVPGAKKRGRPRGAKGTSRAEGIAQQVIMLQEKLQKTSPKEIGPTEALRRYKESLGPRGRQDLDVADGTIMNKIREIRKAR